jgi:hypothetical protein
MEMERSSDWNSTLDTKQSKSEVLKLVGDLKSEPFVRALLLDEGKYALAYGRLYLFLPISEGEGESPANIDFFFRTRDFLLAEYLFREFWLVRNVSGGMAADQRS